MAIKWNDRVIVVSTAGLADANSSSSSVGTATLVGFDLLNYR